MRQVELGYDCLQLIVRLDVLRDVRDLEEIGRSATRPAASRIKEARVTKRQRVCSELENEPPTKYSRRRPMTSRVCHQTSDIATRSAKGDDTGQ